MQVLPYVIHHNIFTELNESWHNLLCSYLLKVLGIDRSGLRILWDHWIDWWFLKLGFLRKTYFGPYDQVIISKIFLSDLQDLSLIDGAYPVRIGPGICP